MENKVYLSKLTFYNIINQGQQQKNLMSLTLMLFNKYEKFKLKIKIKITLAFGLIQKKSNKFLILFYNFILKMQNPYLNTANSNNINIPMTQNATYPYGPTYQAYPNQSYPYQTDNTYPPTNKYDPNGGITNYQNNTVYVANNQTQFDKIQIIEKPQTDTLAHLDSSLYGQARKKFIMKVYLILTIQLALTAAVCFISYYVRPFLIFQVENQWLMWVLLIVMIVVEIFIFCFPAGRIFPINIIALLIFTLCEAYIVSYICSITAYTSSGSLVIVAAVMTLAIVVGLTVYAIFTTTDFTIMWGLIWIILMSFLIFGIFTGIGWSYWLYNLYCVFGVIVFGIYLIFDTQMIVGGKRLQISMDDYVIGALVLYIDIIQMFLYILALFGRR